MACRSLALRSLLLPQPLYYHLRLRAAASAPAARSPSLRRLRCCSSSGAGGDAGQPPQEAVLEAISKVATSKGRVALTTNMVIGGTVTDDSSDEWLVLDQQVNSYPTDRGFTAIGTGGEDFVHSMVDAVESVLQEPIPKGQVTQKVSSQGKYVSVKIGPLRVVSSEQIFVPHVYVVYDEALAVVFQAGAYANWSDTGTASCAIQAQKKLAQARPCVTTLTKRFQLQFIV